MNHLKTHLSALHLTPARRLQMVFACAAFAVFSIASLVVLTRNIQQDLTLRTSAALYDHDLLWASVRAHGRTIKLTGTAPDDANIKQAIALSQSVRGVRDVLSEIALWQPSEDDIAADVKASYYTRATLTANRLILISGHAPNANQQAMLNAYTAERWPNEKLISNLEPQSGAPTSWLSTMGQAFDALLALEEGSIYLEPQHLVVRGIMLERKQRRILKRQLNKQLPKDVKLDFVVTIDTSRKPTS